MRTTRIDIVMNDPYLQLALPRRFAPVDIEGLWAAFEDPHTHEAVRVTVMGSEARVDPAALLDHALETHTSALERNSDSVSFGPPAFESRGHVLAVRRTMHVTQGRPWRVSALYAAAQLPVVWLKPRMPTVALVQLVAYEDAWSQDADLRTALERAIAFPIPASVESLVRTATPAPARP